ncbi:MAG: hypothetical protein KDD33_06295 [Bdellovibrionales bacterium]|nr:hypothetical protein [Bdellovibrionales bacterium]
MEPRLKNSNQWTPFPEELCDQIKGVLQERFNDEYGLEDSLFIVEGRIYQQEILARFGLNVPNQLKQYNFELSFEFDPQKENTLESIQNSMDIIEYLFSEFLEEDMDDSDLPRKWRILTHNKNNYFFQYSTVNSILEKQADQLLEQYEKKLVYDAEEAPEEVDVKGPETPLH